MPRSRSTTGTTAASASNIGVRPEEDYPWSSRPVLDANRFSRGNRRRLSAPGLRTFIAIADLWGLSEEQRRNVLGLPSLATYRRWCGLAQAQRDVTLTVDVLMRISFVLGIHAVLRVLCRDDQEAVVWLRGENHSMPFAGRAPLELVLGATMEGLLTVRRFLEATLDGLSTEPDGIEQDFLFYLDADVVFS